MPNSQKKVIDRNATRLTHVSPGRSILEEIELVTLHSHDVMVETQFSGISRGTERLVFLGKVPRSQWNTMRCPHQVGEFSYPLTYGYACVGKVIARGDEVNSLLEDQSVFVLHPHQNRFIVNANCVHLLPGQLDPATAVLSANMETALNAIWDGELESGQRVAVIGAGVVGLLTAHLVYKTTGKRPVVLDVNPKRRRITEQFGGEFLTAESLSSSGKTEFDRIFNTSASGSGLQLAIDHASFEARIIELSWFGDKKVSLSLGGTFHSKRLQIVSSQVGHISPLYRKNITNTDRIRSAMEHLTEMRFAELLTPVIPFTKLPDLLPTALDNDTDALCPLVTYMD